MFGQIPNRRFAQGLPEHIDETAGVLVSELQGDCLDAVAARHSLQCQDNMKLVAPASEAHSDFLYKQAA